jgi:hypothetical protein
MARLTAEVDALHMDIARELRRPDSTVDSADELLGKLATRELAVRTQRVRLWYRFRDILTADQLASLDSTAPHNPDAAVERSDPRRDVDESEPPPIAPHNPAADAAHPERLGREEISRGMRSAGGKVAACGATLATEATVTARIAIAPSGRAKVWEVTGDVPAALRACVRHALGGLQFPPARTGLTIRYPFVIRAPGGSSSVNRD